MGRGKSVRPRRFFQPRCLEVIKDGLNDEVRAHAIDGTAEIHRDPGVLALFKRGISFPKPHLRMFEKGYIIRLEDGTVETQAVFRCYLKAKRVPVIKEWA